MISENGGLRWFFERWVRHIFPLDHRSHKYPVQLRAKQVPRVTSSLPNEMKMVGMLYFFHYLLLKCLLNNRLKPIVSCECGRHSKPMVTAGSSVGVAP